MAPRTFRDHDLGCDNGGSFAHQAAQRRPAEIMALLPAGFAFAANQAGHHALHIALSIARPALPLPREILTYRNH